MNHVQHTPIQYSELFNDFRNPNSGAVVLFSGEVRDNNKGREVTHLEYEAYEPMANKMIEEILEEAKSRFSLNQAVCVHRLGYVEISGCAVVVITGAGHRKEAYDANRFIIDKVKNEVPIWKHEFFADGTSEWGQNCDCVTDEAEHKHDHHHEKAK
jgi:molybdopterin synthase catalytic subunit